MDPKNKILMRVTKFTRRSASLNDSSSKQDQDHSEDTSEGSMNFDEDCNPCEELLAAVMTATDGDNKLLHSEFQVLPSRRKYPEYYEVIECPIDLKTVARKIQQNEYNSLNEMERDLLLLTKNACLFNEPGSQIYKNAKLLKKVRVNFFDYFKFCVLINCTPSILDYYG